MNVYGQGILHRSSNSRNTNFRRPSRANMNNLNWVFSAMTLRRCSRWCLLFSQIRNIAQSLTPAICSRPILIKFSSFSSMYALTANSFPSIPLDNRHYTLAGLKFAAAIEKQIFTFPPVCKLAGSRTDNTYSNIYIYKVILHEKNPLMSLNFILMNNLSLWSYIVNVGQNILH